MRYPQNISSLGVLALLTGALVSSPAGAQQPAAPALSGEQLAGIYNTAATLAGSVQCAADSQPDLAGARTLAHAAAMLDVAARNYPPPAPRSDPAAHAQKLAALIVQTSQVYEQAYRCAPGYDHRHHLEDARALIDTRLTAIREVEQRPPDHEDYVYLAVRRGELERMMPVPPQPAPVDHERPEPPPDAPPPEHPTSGYARYAGAFVLRPQLGVGAGRLVYDDESGISEFFGAFGGLYAAARFTGKRRTHALIVGGTLNIQQIAQKPQFDHDFTARSLIASALRLEGALHAHPRWVSFHPALELGVQVYVGWKKMGRPYLGPGLGLCLDRELACIAFKYAATLTLPSHTEAKIHVWQIGLGIDIMRIVDRAKGLATP